MFDFLDKTGLKTVLEQIKAKFPSSLPADGGNADTVTGHDGYHLGTISMYDAYYGNDFPMYCKYNVYNDNRFALMIDNSAQPGTTYGVRCDYATNSTNADTVGGKDPKKIFYDNGLSADLNDATQSGCYATSPDTVNVPFSAWWLVDTTNFSNYFIVQKAHVIGNTPNTISYIRNYANDAWSDWTEIYTTGNKPYVTGEIAFVNESNNCYTNYPVPTNHGFMPSIVLYWALSADGGDTMYNVECASSFDETSFTPVTINLAPIDQSPPSYKYGYIIFK